MEMEAINESDTFLVNRIQPLVIPLSCDAPLLTKTFLITTYTILLLTSLFGNLFVIIIFYRDRSLRSSTNYFIVSMAISDLLIPVVVLPDVIAYLYSDGVWLVHGALGDILCKLVHNSRSISSLVSILSMVAIAADRYRAVVHPMRSPLFSGQKCKIVIASTWLVSLIFRAYFLIAAKLVSFKGKLYCYRSQWAGMNSRGMTGKISMLNMVIYLIVVFASAIVLTVLHLCMFVSLLRQKSQLHLAPDQVKKRAKKTRRIAQMLLTVVVVFYSLFLLNICPWFLLLGGIQVPCFFIWFGVNCTLLYPVINPIVYFTFNKMYRRGLMRLLCCSGTPIFALTQNDNNNPNTGQILKQWSFTPERLN